MSDFSETTNRLRDLLVEGAEIHYPTIFNAVPNRSLSSKKEQRYGRKGSLSVQLAGSKRGLWRDFETGEGGGPFEAIMREQGCDFLAALDYAREVLRLGSGESQPRQERRASAKVGRTNHAQDTWRRKSIDRILGECRSIVGSVAETYLRRRLCGADLDFGSLQNLRFHPHLQYKQSGVYYPALIAIVRDRQGVILGIQRTYLTEEGTKAPVPEPKLSLAASKERGMAGGMVILTNPNGTGEETTGEGLETVLSVLAACPGIAISATLGTSGVRNFVPHKSTRRLRFVGDPDKGGREAVAERTEELTSENDELEIAAAFPLVEGEDFNALHKRAGIDAVREAVHRSPFRCAEIRDFQAPIRQRPAFQRNKLRGVQLVDTEAAAAEAVDAFLASKQLDKALDVALDDADDARRTGRDDCAHAICAAAGLGKSVLSLQHIRRRAKVRLTGPDDKEVGPYVYLVPNYNLAQELAVKVRQEIRLEADPTGPKEDESDQINGNHGILIFQGKSRTCGRPEELQALTDEGLSSAGLCMSKDKKTLCPRSAECVYQWQKLEVSEAQLVILVHDYLTIPSLPVELKNARAVFFDETVFHQLVRVSRVTIDSLSATLTMPKLRSDEDRIAWQERADRRASLAKAAIAALERGADPAQAIRKGHAKRLITLTKDAEKNGHCPKSVVETNRLSDWLDDAKRVAGGDDYSSAGITPDMNLAQIKEHVAQYRSGTSKGEAAFWKQVKERVLLLDEAEAYKGDPESAPKVPLPLRIQLRQEGPKSDPRRVVRTAWLASVNWEGIPFIFLDAHADQAFIKPIWPGCQFHKIRVRTQGTIIQIADRTFGKASLIPTPNASLGERAKCAAELARMRHVIATTAKRHRLFLCIAMKEVIEALLLGWTPPINCSFEHFGALRGIDRYKDHDGCLIIGRMQPPTSTLDEYAAAYYDGSQEAPLPLDDGKGQGAKLPLAPALYRLKNGTTYQKDVPQGPTELHRAVLAQFREAELEQAIARLRLVHRTSPATIYVFTSIPLDTEIDQLVSIKDLLGEETRLAAVMREASGVLVASPRAITGYPGALYPSQDAAREDLKRNGVRAEALFAHAAEMTEKGGGEVYSHNKGSPPPFLRGYVIARIRWKEQRGSDTAALIEAGVADPEAAVRAALARAGLEMDRFDIVYQPSTATVIPLPQRGQGAVRPGLEDLAGGVDAAIVETEAAIAETEKAIIEKEAAIVETAEALAIMVENDIQEADTRSLQWDATSREMFGRAAKWITAASDVDALVAGWDVTTRHAFAALRLLSGRKEVNRLRAEHERLEQERVRLEMEYKRLEQEEEWRSA
jgi:hypothetical protein